VPVESAVTAVTPAGSSRQRTAPPASNTWATLCTGRTSDHRAGRRLSCGDAAGDGYALPGPDRTGGRTCRDRGGARVCPLDADGGAGMVGRRNVAARLAAPHGADVTEVTSTIRAAGSPARLSTDQQRPPAGLHSGWPSSGHAGSRTPISGSVDLRLVRWTTWASVSPLQCRRTESNRRPSRYQRAAPTR